MSRRRARAGPMSVALATFVLVSTVPSSSTQTWVTFRRNVDLASSAHPGPEHRRVVDHAYTELASRRSIVEMDTTASASTTCRRCRAEAVTVHVLHHRRPVATYLDNVATAWTGCRRRCRAVALSVQVVVVNRARRLLANNRALALNVGCRRCRTASAAFQIVVVDRSLSPMTRPARRALGRWVDRQVEALHVRADRGLVISRTVPAQQAAAELRGLERVVNAGLGSTTLQASVRVG